MKIDLPNTPEAVAAGHVAKRLRERGFHALWAGGCVRDALLKRTPIDYDVATDAHPDTVLELFNGALATGKSFGVVRVPLDGHWFEVATFREDHDYRDGRHPGRITFSDARKDAERRDFTVNAMFCDPCTGEIIDYVQGLRDLNDKRIRCVGDATARFTEDHLRMLRAVRFASTLCFTLDPDTAAAIREAADQLPLISPERVRGELIRILCEAPAAGDAIMLMDDVGLLEPILPEVKAMQGQQQPPQFHPEGDVFTHTVLMLNRMQCPTPELALSALLHDIGKPPTAVQAEDRWRFNGHATLGADMARAVLRRLRCSRALIDAVDTAIRGHMRFVDVERMKRSTLRRWLGAPTFELELELHRLDCLGSHGDLSHYHFLHEARKEFAQEPVLPLPWLSGDDILRMGVAKGPEVGRWKQRAYELQLEGVAASRAEALKQLRREINAAGMKTVCECVGGENNASASSVR